MNFKSQSKRERMPELKTWNKIVHVTCTAIIKVKSQILNPENICYSRELGRDKYERLAMPSNIKVEFLA